MTEAKWVIDHDQAYLSGELDRDSVPVLWTQIKAQDWSQTNLNVSLEAVSRIDSAGMVMLIHLIQHAKKQNCHIMLGFVPEQLKTLLQLSNVDSLIAQHLLNE